MSELLKVNVSDHIEKKNGLSYLSWAWAWAEVLKIDPQAEWHAVDYTGADGQTVPYMVINGTAMVKTVVKIKGIERECLLPVMDHRNKAIKDPDAFQVNTAIMRCMTKAISMHGLGLYIYAGEDLPEGPEEDKTLIMKVRRSISEHLANDRDGGALQEWEIATEMGKEFASQVWAGITTKDQDRLRALKNDAVAAQKRLAGAQQEPAAS